MNRKIGLDENILFRRVLGEGVVVDQRKAQVMVVNEVALRILELVRESMSAEQIVAAISAEYDADVADIETDVKRFLQDLDEHDMTVDA